MNKLKLQILPKVSLIKSAYRVLALGIILSLIYSRTSSFTLIAAFEGFALAIFLAWFISKVDLKPSGAFILVWFSLFIIGVFNNSKRISSQNSTTLLNRL
jgi:hypothetical protein